MSDKMKGINVNPSAPTSAVKPDPPPGRHRYGSRHMRERKKQYCFNCGEYLGEYRSYPGDLDTCGELECEREARYALESERAERYYEAEADDFSRY